METFRGGILMLFRWLVHYPIVHLTYRVRGWTRAPYLLEPGLENKPGILVSNYGNYLYDNMIGLMTAPVWPHVFVRAPVCRTPLLKYIIRFFRAVPIVRTTDEAYSNEKRVEENEKTFARVSELLRKGHWLSAFPEQNPGHRARIAKPLKPGVAHVALRAEDAAGWGLGLRIYIYGTNYENKFAGRSNVYVRWASPIEVARYRDTFVRNPVEAEQILTAEIERSLHATVLEAATTAQLADAYRLAFQQGRPNFSGIQNALNEVVNEKATPEQLHKIVCRKGRESVLYQTIGYGLLSLGAVVGWPFRMFGRLCATDRSQEMTYQFILWILVLLTGAMIGDWQWAVVQAVGTWGSMSIWLWAWRRGIVEDLI